MTTTNVLPSQDEDFLVNSVRSASAETLLSMHKAHSELAAALRTLEQCNQERESLRSENDDLRRLIGQLRFELDECKAARGTNISRTGQGYYQQGRILNTTHIAIQDSVAINDLAPPALVGPIATSTSDAASQGPVPNTTTDPAIQRHVRYWRQGMFLGRSTKVVRSKKIPGSKKSSFLPIPRVTKVGMVKPRYRRSKDTGKVTLYASHQSILDQHAANNLGINVTVGLPDPGIEDRQTLYHDPTNGLDDDDREAGVEESDVKDCEAEIEGYHDEDCEAGVEGSDGDNFEAEIEEFDDDGLEEAFDKSLTTSGTDEIACVPTIDPKLLTVADTAPYQSYGQYTDPEMETDILFPIDAEEGETEDLPIPAPEPLSTPPPNPSPQDPQITTSSSEASAMKATLMEELDTLLLDSVNSMEDMYFAANFEAGDPSDLSFIDDLPASMGSDAMFDDAIRGFENGTGRDLGDGIELEDLTMEGEDWVLSADYPGN